MVPKLERFSHPSSRSFGLGLGTYQLALLPSSNYKFGSTMHSVYEENYILIVFAKNLVIID